MSHIERKKREKKDIKKRILKAALSIAVAEGWQAVTIRKIAAKIDYTTSIVYEHFESKEALLRELVSAGFKKLYDEFNQACAENIPPKQLLMRLSLINWNFAENNKELYYLMFTYERPSNENAEKGLILIKKVFMDLTGKNEKDVDSIIVNWICLRLGSIGVLMDFHEEDVNQNNKELYIEFINRFIESISK